MELAEEFIEKLNEKARRKVIYNIDKSRYVIDPNLFKKLDSEIWEFRTKYGGLHVRLLAFWVKKKESLSLVVCSHGFIKKVSKVSKAELDKAKKLRKEYLQ